MVGRAWRDLTRYLQQSDDQSARGAETDGYDCSAKRQTSAPFIDKAEKRRCTELSQGTVSSEEALAPSQG